MFHQPPLSTHRNAARRRQDNADALDAETRRVAVDALLADEVARQILDAESFDAASRSEKAAYVASLTPAQLTNFAIDLTCFWQEAGKLAADHAWQITYDALCALATEAGPERVYTLPPAGSRTNILDGYEIATFPHGSIWHRPVGDTAWRFGMPFGAGHAVVAPVPPHHRRPASAAAASSYKTSAFPAESYDLSLLPPEPMEPPVDAPQRPLRVLRELAVAADTDLPF